jgi:hypothetical protein
MKACGESLNFSKLGGLSLVAELAFAELAFAELAVAELAVAELAVAELAFAASSSKRVSGLDMGTLICIIACKCMHKIILLISYML